MRKVQIVFVLLWVAGCSFNSDEIYFKEVDATSVTVPSVSYFEMADSAYLRNHVFIQFGVNTADQYFAYYVLLNEDTLVSGGAPSAFQLNTTLFEDGVHDLTLITQTKSKSGSLADKLDLEVLVTTFSKKVIIDNSPVELVISDFSIVDSVLTMNWEAYDDHAFDRIEINVGGVSSNTNIGTISSREENHFSIPAYKGGYLDLTLYLYAKNEVESYRVYYAYEFEMTVEENGDEHVVAVGKSPFRGKQDFELRHYNDFGPEFRNNNPYDCYTVTEGENIELELSRRFPTKYDFFIYSDVLGENQRFGSHSYVDPLVDILNVSLPRVSHLGSGTFVGGYTDPIRAETESGSTAQLSLNGLSAISKDSRYSVELLENQLRLISNADFSTINSFQIESFGVEGEPTAVSLSKSGVVSLITTTGGNGNPFRPETYHKFYFIDLMNGVLVREGYHRSGPFTGGYPSSTSHVREDLKAITPSQAAKGYYMVIEDEAGDRLRYTEVSDASTSHFPIGKDYYFTFDDQSLMKFTYPQWVVNDGIYTYIENELVESIDLGHNPREIYFSNSYYGFKDSADLFSIFDIDTHEQVTSFSLISEIVEGDIYYGLQLIDNYVICITNNTTILREF